MPCNQGIWDTLISECNNTDFFCINQAFFDLFFNYFFITDFCHNILSFQKICVSLRTYYGIIAEVHYILDNNK